MDESPLKEARLCKGQPGSQEMPRQPHGSVSFKLGDTPSLSGNSTCVGFTLRTPHEQDLQQVDIWFASYWEAVNGTKGWNQ